MKTSRAPNVKHAAIRNGVAAVEAALMLPLLVIVTFGAIDLAQYITLGQVICNASREGARIASRSDTDSVDDVENAVIAYLANSIPQLSSDELESAVKIALREQTNVDDEECDCNGSDWKTINNEKLSSIESGDPILIQIDFDFSSIRWLSGIAYSNPTSTTICRRE